MNDLPYATIVVSGDDALEFLQGQLSADLRELENVDCLLSAWCNPKGRVISLLRVRAVDGGYALTLPADIVEVVLKRLSLFRFRSKVDFEARGVEPDDLGLGGLDSAEFENWRLMNLRNGIAEIGADQTEHYTPHMLNLDLLGAISLDKGCYTGQEIVARTHYRGASKRRLHLFESSVPLAAGDKVSTGDRTVGTVVNAIGLELLAVVPDADITTGLWVGDVKLDHQALANL